MRCECEIPGCDHASGLHEIAYRLVNVACNHKRHPLEQGCRYCIRAALEAVVRDCATEASQPCEEPSMSAPPWSHHVDAAAAILRRWGLEEKP